MCSRFCRSRRHGHPHGAQSVTAPDCSPAVWNRTPTRRASSPRSSTSRLPRRSPSSPPQVDARGLVRLRRRRRARGRPRTCARAEARRAGARLLHRGRRDRAAGGTSCSRRRACEFLDCPVSGGVEGARDGTLAIMVGGDQAAFERAQPVLKALGRTIAHFGPTGSGQAAKATNQIMCAGIIEAVAEAMAFAHAQGLPLDKLIDTLGKGAGSSWYFVHRAPNMARGAYPAGFRVRLHAKDLRHLPRHGGALRRGAAGGRAHAGRVRRAHRPRLRRRGHLRHLPAQGGAVRAHQHHECAVRAALT